MKFTEIDEDEYSVVKGKLSAKVFFIGDGTAEVVLEDDGIDLIGSEKGRGRKVNDFAHNVAKALRKKDIARTYVTADAGSAADKAMSAGKAGVFEYSEYMFKKEADLKNKPSEDPDSCIILDTKAAEDTDFEEKNAISVKSREAGVFSAKIMPFKDGMYVYEVEVAEALRHKGYGTKHMEALLRAFSDGPIYLQVSSKNVPAVGLYKKLGFEVATGINYYLISA